MSRRGRNSSQFGSNKFVVYMFEEDYENVIKDTVLKHPDLETGGDLFGLWTSEGRDLKPLIHIVLGPGEDCKRAKYSFFQDVPYLQRVGNHLANDYMLGHIGEWHSHHRLTLREPSSGDYSTVRRNYPSGYHGFLLIIANILPYDEVTLSPFLFRENGEVQVGNVVLIAGSSPFRGNSLIKGVVNQGAERRTEKGIDNEGMTGESAKSTGDGEDVSEDVHMKSDFWYRSDNRDKTLGEVFDGIEGITQTSKEPFSISFTFGGGIGKETATKVLSMLQEVTDGDEKIKMSFDFNRNSNHWTVELPADYPRSPVTLQCVNQTVDEQAKEDIQKDNMREIIDKIELSVLRKRNQTYA